ncbi:hypothetical protein [Paraburkholderia hayleyella]|uniref:hypothetical protein n=1 Tax=Paraburkholderia hayleyella TaxID=2152889 RepID=UPI00157FC987|nr:hypothetical protein [Paraburkholderia hayleyella]
MFELLNDALVKTLNDLPHHAGQPHARDALFQAASTLEQAARACLNASSPTQAAAHRVVADGLNAAAELCRLAAA